MGLKRRRMEKAIAARDRSFYDYVNAAGGFDAVVEEGWTYELAGGQGRDAERVESMRLSEEQLSLAWLTANRRVDNNDSR